ncbi:TetR/AcrR family transcriptional regulator [Mycetocola lacteus]|uniref:TetR/AcrR family transcriptional regulator n=1 Tax=Mycetocola lacteus TaxID=76637 RepID=A0A3L7AWM4_9MICO|nr:TetR family transcriptional regulator [Mycetocola lacteus]RLP84766.1 TetR/AcrR family transcriptional regulator [Mycetocola lacteus]
MTIQRARSSDAKAQRAEDLLDAAESLALELGGVRHVTLAPVTERAGLHRTAVRRYFESKEELLLELAERGWKQWRESIDLALEGRAGLDARAVADVLTDTLTALPVFCDCLTHVALSLEGDVSIERARRFKRNAFSEHDALVAALTDASVLSVEVVTALVPAASALAASMWQVSHPSPSLAELYVQEPQWGHVAYDFEPRLRLLVESTAIGLSETLPRRAE